MNKYFNITEEHVYFIVKENERKVICILPEVKNTISEIIDEYNTIDIGCCMNFRNYRNKFYMKNKIVGIATCAPEDEWDVEKGKKVAFFKVKNKYYTSVFKRLNTYINEADHQLNKFIDEINRVGEKISSAMESENKHIKKLTNAEEKN